jgi:hypothetical protein
MKNCGPRVHEDDVRISDCGSKEVSPRRREEHEEAKGDA